MTFNANGGADSLTVDDAAGDTVDCGPGADAVRADALDTAAGNCETVDGPVGPPSPPPAGGTTTTTTTVTETKTLAVPGPVITTTVLGPPTAAAASDTTPPGLTLGAVPKRLTLKRALKGIKVTVTPDEPSALPVELDGAASKATLAGVQCDPRHKALPLAAGARTVTLRPSRRLVGKARRLSLQVAVTATDAAGNRSRTSARLKATG
jgi:hypothetical protein